MQLWYMSRYISRIIRVYRRFQEIDRNMPYISRNVIAWHSQNNRSSVSQPVGSGGGGARVLSVIRRTIPVLLREGWAASKTVRTVHRLSREWLPLISTGEGRKKLPNAFNMLPASWYQLAPRHPPPAFCVRIYGGARRRDLRDCVRRELRNGQFHPTNSCDKREYCRRDREAR